MEFVKRKCSKCGYVIEVPDSTTSVICGSCGENNRFGKISSILKNYAETGTGLPGREKSSGRYTGSDKTIPVKTPSDISKPAYKSIPDQFSQQKENNSSPDEDKEVYPEEKSASKIMTLIFILAPFIAMAVEFFKLPPYAAFAVILLILAIVIAIKKRS